MVVDDASWEVGKDRGEGDSAFKLRGVPFGGGRRAGITVRGDSGADRTACDSAPASTPRRFTLLRFWAKIVPLNHSPLSPPGAMRRPFFRFVFVLCVATRPAGANGGDCCRAAAGGFS